MQWMRWVEALLLLLQEHTCHAWVLELEMRLGPGLRVLWGTLSLERQRQTAPAPVPAPVPVPVPVAQPSYEPAAPELVSSSPR